MSDVALAWSELVFALQRLFIKPGDHFANGSLPASWGHYLLCRVIGHEEFGTYTAGSGNLCEECVDCGLRRTIRKVE